MDAKCTEGGSQARAAPWSTFRHCSEAMAPCRQHSCCRASPASIPERCWALPRPTVVVSPPPLRPGCGDHRRGHHWQVYCLGLLLHLLRLLRRALPHGCQVRSPHTSELPSAMAGGSDGARAWLSPWPHSIPWRPRGAEPCPCLPLPFAPPGRLAWDCARCRHGWRGSWPR